MKFNLIIIALLIYNIGNAQTIPATLIFNTMTTSENSANRQRESEPVEICASWNFDKLTNGIIYSGFCNNSMILDNLKILYLRNSNISSSDNWSYEYMCYDINQIEYNYRYEIMPSVTVIVSYYYGKFSLLRSFNKYDPNTLKLIEGSGGKYYNTEHRIGY